MSEPGWSAPRAVPVSILTGFLGAGKTTLINRFVGTPFLADAALIINEFGDIGIDHLLVESSSDGIIELSDGCLCCTVRGELIDTLSDLMDKRQTGRIRPFSRVVIETTGLADPVPVIQAVIGHPVLSSSYRLEGLVTAVDAVNGLATLEEHAEARRQVAVADRIVVTKAALAAARGIDPAALRAEIVRLNPSAAIVDGDGALDPAALFDCGAYDPAVKTLDVGRWLGEATHEHHGHAHHHHTGHDHAHHDDHAHHAHHDVTRHGDRIRSQSIVLDAAIPPAGLSMFLDILRSAHGPNLLRMKGIVKLADDPSRPVVIHAVQALMAEPVRLKAWPEGSGERTRIVVITRDMPDGFIESLFGAFSGVPAVGRPDAQALADNPLAIPGFPAGR